MTGPLSGRYEKRWVLITGASAGIGEAFARAYAKHGAKLILTARREALLDALAEQLYQEHGTECLVLPADLADPAVPAQIVEAIEAKGIQVDILVNNAGYGMREGFFEATWDAHRDFLQVLVSAACEFCYRLVPGMRERGYGRVINVSSMAPFFPAASTHSLYAGCKGLLNNFSESLSASCLDTGVHVTAVCPGFTYTEFHDVLGNREEMNQTPKWLWYQAEAVVEEAIAASEADRVVAHIGMVYKILALVFRLIPQRLALALARRQERRLRATRKPTED